MTLTCQMEPPREQVSCRKPMGAISGRPPPTDGPCAKKRRGRGPVPRSNKEPRGFAWNESAKAGVLDAHSLWHTGRNHWNGELAVSCHKARISYAQEKIILVTLQLLVFSFCHSPSVVFVCVKGMVLGKHEG